MWILRDTSLVWSKKPGKYLSYSELTCIRVIMSTASSWIYFRILIFSSNNQYQQMLLYKLKYYACKHGWLNLNHYCEMCTIFLFYSNSLVSKSHTEATILSKAFVTGMIQKNTKVFSLIWNAPYESIFLFLEKMASISESSLNSLMLFFMEKGLPVW